MPRSPCNHGSVRGKDQQGTQIKQSGSDEVTIAQRPLPGTVQWLDANSKNCGFRDKEHVALAGCEIVGDKRQKRKTRRDASLDWVRSEEQRRESTEILLVQYQR